MEQDTYQTVGVYVGQDTYQAGYLAAGLLHGHLRPSESLLILHLTTHFKEALHYRAKEEGCRAYFEQLGYPPEKVQAHHFPNYDNPNALRASIDGLLNDHPVGAMMVTSSRAHYLAEALSDGTRVPILGFDPISANVELLKRGQIQFLINQHPKAQGYLGAMLMLDQLIRKQEIPPLRFLPLEIVVRENVDYLSQDLLLV